jgi:Ca2+-binding EF-hand superfamily protein
MVFRFVAGAFLATAAGFAGWQYALRASAPVLPPYQTTATFRRFRRFASIAPPPPADGDDPAAPREPVMTVDDFLAALTSANAPTAAASAAATGADAGEGSTAPVQTTSIAHRGKHDPRVRALVARLIDMIDSDRSGKIEYREFATLQTLLAMPVMQLSGALELFDRPGQGRVTLSQFRALLRALSGGAVGSAQASAPSASQGSTAAPDAASTSLGSYFFGADGTQTVTFETFIERLADIRDVVRAVEFYSELVPAPTAAAAAASTTTAGAIPALSSGGGFFGGAGRANAQDRVNAQDRATLRDLRARLIANTSLVAAEPSVSVPRVIDESKPLVTLADYDVIMALLAHASRWTPAVRLFLSKDGNEMTRAMLARILKDIDISSQVPATSAIARGLRTVKSPSHTRVFVSEAQAALFAQLMDINGDGTINVEEVEEIAQAHSSMFAAFVPEFSTAPRNAIQNWFNCMQQH